MALKNNTWKINQWYDQAVAGNISYSGAQQLWAWGSNTYGQLGQNNVVHYSSPVQIGSGSTWSSLLVNQCAIANITSMGAIKTDGTLWMWGSNWEGQLGQNQATNARYSSPVQVPGTTWSSGASADGYSPLVFKTDGTAWVWGNNGDGTLGLNQSGGTKYSSPVQLPGTGWSTERYDTFAGNYHVVTVKTDGTLWAWGRSGNGQTGDNSTIFRSSPTQIPGTTWSGPVAGSLAARAAIKTDGTLWAWGSNESFGQLGQNSINDDKSSPVQIPGTTWKHVTGDNRSFMATKTDGTAWVWGYNTNGQLGVNDRANRSSPTQIGTDTTWDICSGSYEGFNAIKTDGTLWAWGANLKGQLGLNNETVYSSPVQVTGGGSWVQTSPCGVSLGAIKQL